MPTILSRKQTAIVPIVRPQTQSKLTGQGLPVHANFLKFKMQLWSPREELSKWTSPGHQKICPNISGKDPLDVNASQIVIKHTQNSVITLYAIENISKIIAYIYMVQGLTETMTSSIEIPNISH